MTCRDRATAHAHQLGHLCDVELDEVSQHDQLTIRCRYLIQGGANPLQLFILHRLPANRTARDGQNVSQNAS
jgi:hypothetical protein